MGMFVSVARNIISGLSSQYLQLLSEDVTKAVKVSINIRESIIPLSDWSPL